VVAIAAGDFHSLALRANGKVVAWGSNNYRQASGPNGTTDVLKIFAGGLESILLVDAT
jgi:alpha-tubulin suppressor-like RCC1 family protein